MFISDITLIFWQHYTLLVAFFGIGISVNPFLFTLSFAFPKLLCGTNCTVFFFFFCWSSQLSLSLMPPCSSLSYYSLIHKWVIACFDMSHFPIACFILIHPSSHCHCFWYSLLSVIVSDEYLGILWLLISLVSWQVYCVFFLTDNLVLMLHFVI